MRSSYVVVILMLFCITSCGRRAQEITEKPAPKPAPPVPEQTAEPAVKPASADLEWSAPESWKLTKETGPLRTTKYEVNPKPGAIVHVSITPLRGTAGGPLANTNRWRGQIGLMPVNDSQLAKISSWVELPVGKARVVDVAGLEDDAKSESVIHAAMISHKGRTWFIKMVGLRRTVDDAMKKQFIGFVRSFH